MNKKEDKDLFLKKFKRSVTISLNFEEFENLQLLAEDIAIKPGKMAGVILIEGINTKLKKYNKKYNFVSEELNKINEVEISL